MINYMYLSYVSFWDYVCSVTTQRCSRRSALGGLHNKLTNTVCIQYTYCLSLFFKTYLLV